MQQTPPTRECRVRKSNDRRLARKAMTAISLSVILLATTRESAAEPLAPVAGRWLNDSRKTLVEIAPCGRQLCGHIVRISNPDPGEPAVDAKNPDPALRNRPLQGLTILTGFTADGDRWRGQIYNPKSGKTYRSELERTGNTLTVKACIGPFCRSLNWTQAK